MAHFNHNNNEQSVGISLAIAFLLGTWLLTGLGIQGIFQMLVPEAAQPTYLRKGR